MSNDIYSVSLLDLMPQSLLEDPFVKALAMSFDPELQAISVEILLCSLLPRIDKLSEPIIDHLAFQFHVDFYESTLPLATKRSLVKESIPWHRHKGTPWAVEQAVSMIFGNGKVSEWFEYGGNPYYFRVNVDASLQGASASDLTKLEALVNEYKNTRSWLEIINIFLTSKGVVYLGAATAGGEKITVYPWSTRKIESHIPLTIGIGCQALETIAVNPR